METERKTEARAKRAIKATSTNWPAIVACVCFSVVMCSMASNLGDGSEARTIILGAVTSFFAVFLGYVFTGKKE